MNRTSDFCKEYKNGNITIKYDSETIKAAERDEILTLSEVLYWIDCYIVGEEFCLSNYEMGCMIYNNYSDFVYIFPFSAMDDLKAGKTVRLYARRPDEWQRESINREFYGDEIEV